MREKRQLLCEQTDQDVFDRYTLCFLSAFSHMRGSEVSGYWPFGSEVDVKPMLERLAGEGFRCSLPYMNSEEDPMLFRRWIPGDSLDKAAFGFEQPKINRPVVAPDICLVPVLGFDKSGHRLGYGRGCYDRAIGGLREDQDVIVIGIGFDALQLEDVKWDHWDQQMDYIITESGLMKF